MSKEVDHVEVVVVGGGVVGLAIARALAQAGREVVLLEAEAKTGTGVSSRSSEVIHAGLYYPTDSLRAALCVAGREALYAFCEAHGVPHRRTGKLIVATDAAQHEKLAALHAQALRNGVDDVVALTAREVHALEPAVCCTAALWSPSTGIVDSHALLEALRVDANEAGAVIACRSRVYAVEQRAPGFLVRFGDEGTESAGAISTSQLINAAGLGAREVALCIEGLAAHTVPKLVLAKGNYYGLEGTRAPFRRLVYPLPEPGGLGVHLTLDLAGRARFGPDVEWTERIDYDVDPRRAEGFYAAVRRFWPALPDGALTPDYAGLRPKITGPGEPAADFVVLDAGDHGVPSYLGLHGIESPGLTCCLALADHVVARLASA